MTSSLIRDSILSDESIPQHVKDTLSVFTDEEVESLSVVYQYETGLLDGIQCFDKQTNQFYKFAEPAKAAALAILDEQLRKERM